MNISSEVAFLLGLTLGQWVTLLIIFRVVLPIEKYAVIACGKTWLLKMLNVSFSTQSRKSRKAVRPHRSAKKSR